MREKPDPLVSLGNMRKIDSSNLQNGGNMREKREHRVNYIDSSNRQSSGNMRTKLE